MEYGTELSLLSYHRRLWVISDVLALRMKGGLVSWCLGVVSHGYSGLGGGWDGGGGWFACGTKPRGLIACR